MAIVSSLFIRWGITEFAFRAYIVQFDGDLNSVGEYNNILHRNKFMMTA